MASKNFLTGFERDTIQTLQESYECASCFEPITNPICHECLGNQITQWLGFYPNIKKKMLPKSLVQIKLPYLEYENLHL